MNIKRCDRCDKEIKCNGNWLYSLAETIQKAVNGLTGKPTLRLTDANSGKELDLCEDCQKSLRIWMKEGHPEKHPEEKIKTPKVRKAYIIPEPEMTNAQDLKFGD